MTSSLWTADEIIAATGAQCFGDGNDITGTSIDTRTIQNGDLFFALAGDARDGHDFVVNALANGAGAAMVSLSRAEGLKSAGRLFAVPGDVLEGMQKLAVAARNRAKGPVIAVTGSVGKTGTKEALKLVLSRQAPTHASVASYNNHWGVPLTLTRAPRDTFYGIYEIGMNHALEIVPLTKLVRPNIAIITTVAPVHLEFFKSIADIADAKAEIFEGIEAGGTVILPMDSPYFERLKMHASASRAGRILSFGEGEKADIRAIRIDTTSEYSDVVVSVFGREISYRIGSPGKHVALNSLAVLAAVFAASGNVDDAADALIDLVPPAGRGERLILGSEKAPFLLVDESYNANPASMRAALANLGMVDLSGKGRRIAVLGAMGELGPQGPELHKELAQSIIESGVNLVFAAGSLMKNLVDALPENIVAAYAESSEGLIESLNATVQAHDAVMVKGSLSSKMGLIVSSLKERHGVVGSSAMHGSTLGQP
ncbi:UDP-N-acetylmuramoylalanyl-D-glutamyl-2,6-diaminopimelate--D-alanyl-D-alanine ligase [Microvirga sp. W0021]|uniref:UDP-N-acetylmuramoyl-tripeptide--D-alanyl-D-alanine ligase n=1 Tax=Hohaiivirga grylli TaxID=3133970 RepID=A0ABV0BLW5_9HYPH